MSDENSNQIRVLDLPVRAYFALVNEGVDTIGELRTKTKAELLSFNNFGKRSLEAVETALHKRGLQLASDRKQRIFSSEPTMR